MKISASFIGKVFAACVVTLVLFYIGLLIWGFWHDEWSGYNDSAHISDGYCNIAVIPIVGDITSYGESVDEYEESILTTTMEETISLLEITEYDPYIAGVMMVIDSTGGAPAASEQITNEIKRSSMPTAAHIIDYGVSGAYLVATGADRVFASPFSDVGSIGVTMSYLEYSERNRAEGLEFVSLASAEFKDYGSPDKPLTPEERLLLERDLQIFHDEFVKQVANNRDMNIEQVAELADGSTLPGSLALEAGLIDELGDREVVREWFANELGLPSEEVVFCQ
ncbi:S49 family peptidase [Candidatus Kaiserbacteria bacterium]|nr:S49 family peptidase [Candidatus Kaiserbacteria bacterium]